MALALWLSGCSGSVATEILCPGPGRLDPCPRVLLMSEIETSVLNCG